MIFLIPNRTPANAKRRRPNPLAHRIRIRTALNFPSRCAIFTVASLTILHVAISIFAVACAALAEWRCATPEAAGGFVVGIGIGGDGVGEV